MNDLLLKVSALLAKPEFHLSLDSSPDDFVVPLVQVFGSGIYPAKEIAQALIHLQQDNTIPVPDDHYEGY